MKETISIMLSEAKELETKAAELLRNDKEGNKSKAKVLFNQAKRLKRQVQSMVANDVNLEDEKTYSPSDEKECASGSALNQSKTEQEKPKCLERQQEEQWAERQRQLDAEFLADQEKQEHVRKDRLKRVVMKFEG